MPKVSGSRSLILSHTGRWSPDMDCPKSSLYEAFQPTGVLNMEWLVEAVELFELRTGLTCRPRD